MTAIRRPGASSAAMLLGLSTSLVAAHLFAPEWSRRTGLDVWNLPSANAALRDATAERERVTAYGESAARRREAAAQIAVRLASGAITLATATDEIMEVFRDDPGMSSVLEATFSNAPTERHRFARHIIDRVKRVLADDPNHAAAVLAHLEDGYRALSASPDVHAVP